MLHEVFKRPTLFELLKVLKAFMKTSLELVEEPFALINGVCYPVLLGEEDMFVLAEVFQV